MVGLLLPVSVIDRRSDRLPSLEAGRGEGKAPGCWILIIVRQEEEKVNREGRHMIGKAADDHESWWPEVPS